MRYEWIVCAIAVFLLAVGESERDFAGAAICFGLLFVLQWPREKLLVAAFRRFGVKD